MTNIVWCEGHTHNYYFTSFLAEFFNSISNVSFVLVSIYGLYSSRKKHYPVSFFFSELSMFVVGISSFFFHAMQTDLGEFLDEFGMSILGYFYCQISGKKVTKEFNLVLGLLWLYYLYDKSHEIFQVIFLLQILMTIKNIIFISGMSKDIFLSVFCLVVAKAHWSHERLLHDNEICPMSLNNYSFYNHTIWHIMSSLGHFFLMKHFRVFHTKNNIKNYVKNKKKIT